MTIGASEAKQIVSSGYDQMAAAYLRWTSHSSIRLHWLNAIIPRLPAAAHVLDLGCGAGLPVARQLADRGCTLMGVDASRSQIKLARENEPRAEFVEADMTSLEFDAMSLDAVTAFYSITHVPREEHLALLQRIRNWLKPGGLFLVTLGATDTPAWTGEWLGVPMYFSHFDAATNHALMATAGFEIERAEVIGEEEHGEIARFLWIIARRPIVVP
jgi:SAM-dependent methyltransferase